MRQNEVTHHWVAHVEENHYIIGSVVGPHSYPAMVRDFQRIIGDETREQMFEAYSISKGLDYPGVRPEHSALKESGRVEYTSITDKEALETFSLLSKLEGVIPALESSHAIAQVMKTEKPSLLSPNWWESTARIKSATGGSQELHHQHQNSHKLGIS